jgi:cell division protein FtsB
MPSARSAAPAPRRPARNQRPRPRRVAQGVTRIRFRWDRAGRIGLLITLVVVAGLYVQHTLEFLSSRSQAQTQLAIVQRLVRENHSLVQQQKTWGDPAVIQRAARALGMVKAGERPYVITGLPKH